jgi:serine protease Do
MILVYLSLPIGIGTIKTMPEKVVDAIQKVIQQSVPASCTIYVKTGKKSWSGSGFHIGNGYVCTASHVAPPDSGEIKLTFDKKVMYSARIHKTDPNIDSAVLKIEGDFSNIPTVSLADSDNLQLGETVAVIGSPEGWHDSISVGRISNMHQSMGQNAPSQSWNDVIFVDAKILQGVSGGMCIGTDGLVIGSVIGVVGMLVKM